MIKSANKTANIKYEKLTSLHYCVRATKSHIQNSRNHFKGQRVTERHSVTNRQAECVKDDCPELDK